MKVKFSDKRLLKSFATVISGISTVLSLVLIFVDVPDNIIIRSILAILFLLAIIVVISLFHCSPLSFLHNTRLAMYEMAQDRIGAQINQSNIIIPTNSLLVM